MANFNLAFFMMIGWLQMHAAVVIAILIALVVLYGALLGTGHRLFNGKAFVQGLGVFAILWALFAALLPGLTGSAWQFVSYSTDYVMLALMSAGLAGVGFLLVYPILGLMQPKA